MKRFMSIIAIPMFAVLAFFAIGVAPSANAQSPIQAGVDAARGSGVPEALLGDTGIITTITNTLLFIAGALAVIMIIFGGLRYVTSAGNASNVTAAKNTILYAIVGLIIAFLAFALVNWVLGALVPGSGAAGTNV